MKAGKSSLLTEILRNPNDKSQLDILPSSQTRCTARATCIKYGAQLAFQVGNGPKHKLASCQDQAFVNAICLNDADRANVSLVQQVVTLYMPNDFLKYGLEFVDLPGLNENDQINQVVNDMLPTLDLIIYLFSSTKEFATSVCFFSEYLKIVGCQCGAVCTIQLVSNNYLCIAH